jgi:hypothetical protein
MRQCIVSPWRTVFGKEAMGTKFRHVGRRGVCIRKRERPLREPRVGPSLWALFLLGAVSALLAVNAGGADAAPTADADRSVQSVPGTSGLSSVACTSKSSCVAVGSVGGEGVVVPIDNGVPGPAQVLSDTDSLTSVTCTKAGKCIAAGLAQTEYPPPQPNSTAGAVVEIKNGQTSLSGLFLGTGTIDHPDSVYGVEIACSDTAHCMAVGNSFFELGIGDNVLKGQTSPVHPINSGRMSGVECSRGDWCVADGQVPGSKGVPAAGFAQFVQIGGANGDIAAGPIVDFGANSDPSGGTCRGSLEFCQMAGVVGDEGAVFSVVGESSGLTRPVAGTSSLNDLACAGSYWCLAVGQTTAGEGAVVPVGWEDPITLQTVTGIDQFSGVSCPAPSFCVAVGTTGTGNSTTGAIDIFQVWG